MKDYSEYIGRWIAVVDDKLVAVGDSGKEVFDKAKRVYPGSEPFIMKVPRNVNYLIWAAG